MVIYLVDSAIQLLNNWGQNSIIIVVIIWAVKPAVPTIFKSFVDKALTGNLDLWNVTLVHLYLRILYKVSCKQWFLQARCDRSGFSPLSILEKPLCTGYFQGCALRRIERSPVLWTYEIQCAPSMFIYIRGRSVLRWLGKSDSSVEGEPRGNWRWNSTSRDVVASVRAPWRTCLQATCWYDIWPISGHASVYFTFIMKASSDCEQSVWHYVCLKYISRYNLKWNNTFSPQSFHLNFIIIIP